jgi:hypothetical protein
VTVGGNVRLEVLDWGGNGRPVLFIGGYLTDHAHDAIAPKLTDRFHVYALTRDGDLSAGEGRSFSGCRHAELRMHPALTKFRADVDAEFGFLEKELGFRKERGQRPSNEFAIWFVNATTRILVEGINWGGSARVAFGSVGPLDQFENFDLLDFAAIRCPDQVPIETGSLPGQSQQLRVLSALLRRCGAEVLRGDFSTAPLIRERRQRRVEEWEQEQSRRGRPRTRPSDT